MSTWLEWAVYAGIAVLTVVLAVGVINLIRTDENARSRSNKLMRLRVAVQAVVIALLVALGWSMGAFGGAS
jgi:Hypoxia induced protein conserved region